MCKRDVDGEVCLGVIAPAVVWSRRQLWHRDGRIGVNREPFSRGPRMSAPCIEDGLGARGALQVVNVQDVDGIGEEILSTEIAGVWIGNTPPPKIRSEDKVLIDLTRPWWL